MSIWSDIRIHVHKHALEQFALRFASEAPTSQEGLESFRDTISEEIREAMANRRYSTDKPYGFDPDAYSRAAKDTLFMWTANKLRCYCVRFAESPPTFMVVTTMRSTETDAAA